MAHPGKRLQPGHVVVFGDGILKGEIKESLENGNKLVKFTYETQTFFEALDIVGKLPLPHYITEELKDASLYQTEYAKILGSAAAPTAGLHFTKELLNKPFHCPTSQISSSSSSSAYWQIGSPVSASEI